jgi:glutamine synthetase
MTNTLTDFLQQALLGEQEHKAEKINHFKDLLTTATYSSQSKKQAINALDNLLDPAPLTAVPKPSLKRNIAQTLKSSVNVEGTTIMEEFRQTLRSSFSEITLENLNNTYAKWKQAQMNNDQPPAMLKQNLAEVGKGLLCSL